MSKEYTIVFVGGSFGGLASLKYFIKQYKATPRADPYTTIKIYLIDPRAGFINLMGIPKALMDLDFARSSYLNVENYNLKFDTVESTDELFKEKVLSQPNEGIDGISLHFIHGKCISFIDNNSLNYRLNADIESDVPIRRLTFDYALYATGRRRTWPFDPVGHTEEQYIHEMNQIKPKIEAAKTIGVIGAGALGIEIAGEIKDEFSDKHVILIHPHPFLPPEVFASRNIKNQLRDHLEDIGIDVRFNTRIVKETEDGELITTTGETIKADLNLWCNAHQNNIEPLLPVFQDAIELKTNEVKVDRRMLMEGQNNIFVVGDVTNLPVVKTAGGAYHQGERVAQTLINLLIKKEEVYDEINLAEWPRGMTIVVGTGRASTQWDDIGDGKVIKNDPSILDYYKDYCTANTKLLLNIND